MTVNGAQSGWGVGKGKPFPTANDALAASATARVWPTRWSPARCATAARRPWSTRLMKELGLSGADLAGLAGGLTGQLANGRDTAPTGDDSVAAE